MTDLPMATDAPQPKTIFEPVDIPHLLQGWLVHAHKGRQRHDWAARRCDTHRRRIGGSAAVFSAIVGTSVFAVLEKAELDIMLKIGVAAIAIVAAILTNLITFLNLAEQAEKHRSAGVRYKIMIRELEYILCAPDNKPTNADAPGVKKQLDNLEETAPVVPEWLYEKVEEEWKKKASTLWTRLFASIHIQARLDNARPSLSPRDVRILTANIAAETPDTRSP